MAYVRKWQRQMHLRGRCTACGRKRYRDGARCHECNDRVNAAQRLRRAERKQKGD